MINMTRSLKVLLVDDDDEDYIIIKDLLSDLPNLAIQLDWVGTYEKAREIMQRREHDAYLVDFRLGSKTGLDLIAETSSHRESPVIILTGQGAREVDIEAMQRGAADYLVKNQLTGPLLERCIRYAVRRTMYIKELKEREDSVRSIIDAAFEGILILDLSGKILDANSAAARSLGYEASNLIGRKVDEFFSADASNLLVSAAHEVAPKTFKTICVRPNGSNVHLEVSTKSYSYLGQPAILAACDDVSERLQMEAQILQQDRLASIGLLASSLAHEIGTPLGVMRGRAEIILMQSDDGSSMAKNANIIVTQIDRITKLIHSLLNLARGDRPQAVGSIDLWQVLNDVLELTGHEFNRNQIRSENLVPKNTMVRAAAGPLHQVLLNLLVNSIHAIQSAAKQGRTTDHSVKIEATSKGGAVCVKVQDSGCGISEANMKKLFTPFFTTKEIGVGTGLGLATSYRLLESWGGSIQVQSQEGVGTTFSLFFQRPDTQA